MSLELGLMALTKIIGLPYADATVERNDIIRFVPEPDNEFDELAIRAENLGGEKIGYVAKRLPKVFTDYPAHGVWNNQLMSRMIGKDKAYSAKVIKVEPKALLVSIHECCMCDECRFNPHSGRKKFDCFSKEFWIDDVIARADEHYINEHNQVMFFTYGEGGFGNTRYNIKTENGRIRLNVGLWHRGDCPSDFIRSKLQKGTTL